MKISLCAFGAVLAMAAGAAAAHVTLEYPAAPAASMYKATFKVGHGCDGAATRQIVVDIPAGVRGVHPMPKPGWQLTTDAADKEVTRVSWTARSKDDELQNDWYDEFALVARLPQAAGTVYWPVHQVCAQGRADWVEVPRAGQSAHELKTPAAALEVLPGGGEAGAMHMH